MTNGPYEGGLAQAGVPPGPAAVAGSADTVGTALAETGGGGAEAVDSDDDDQWEDAEDGASSNGGELADAHDGASEDGCAREGNGRP